jgi:HEPN domain-containing protein
VKEVFRGQEANAVNRSDLQQLARERLREARALLAARCWSGAYYLAGYAVECGLKACIIKRLMTTDEFPERKFSEQCWTHNLAQLLGLAGLKSALDAAFATDPDLSDNWDTVKEWSEASRYARTPKVMAEDLYQAITGKKHGVFAWIKGHW